MKLSFLIGGNRTAVIQDNSEEIRMVDNDDDTELELNEESEGENEPEAFNPATTDGFHVMRGDGVHLGTYETEEDAQAFIDGHIAPQDIEASIVEGHSSGE